MELKFKNIDMWIKGFMDVGILSNMGELKFIINININIYIKITYIGSLVFYYK